MADAAEKFPQCERPACEPPDCRRIAFKNDSPADRCFR